MATLSATEILQDTLDAFKAMVPMLSAFSTDFSAAPTRLNDTITAHISGLPSVQDYDATSGYELNNVEADSLLTDVSVALNRHKHVPVRVKYLTQLASRKNLYAEAIKNQAYVLGKSVVDYALTLVTDANVTNETVESTANTSYETLEKVRTALNTQDASQIGRFGIVSSAFAQAIQTDSRVGSGDYYGQLNGATGYRNFRGISGFENLWEYPDMPTNSINLAGVFGDRRLITVATRLPDVQGDLASALGVPATSRFEVATDPETGLSLLGVYWQKQGTLDVWMTIALIYGATCGTAGGSANTRTDPAGHKVVTS